MGARVMTASALAGRLVTTVGILDDGVLEVRHDGTIGYVGPASGWSGPPPEPVDTVAPGYVDIHCHGGGGPARPSGDPAPRAAGAPHPPPPAPPPTPARPAGAPAPRTLPPHKGGPPGRGAAA